MAGATTRSPLNDSRDAAAAAAAVPGHVVNGGHVVLPRDDVTRRLAPRPRPARPTNRFVDTNLYTAMRQKKGTGFVLRASFLVLDGNW